jgi:nucleoside-diphosphate kinase
MAQERTLIILKPETLQRSLIGEIIHRFERKGLKILAMKMARLDDSLLDQHYAHHSGKPFFPSLKENMMHSPVVIMILEGDRAVEGVRLITGATKGVEADAGTIRGDFAMGNKNLVHASDTVENATIEIERFFKPEELHEYHKMDSGMIYEM